MVVFKILAISGPLFCPKRSLADAIHITIVRDPKVARVQGTRLKVDVSTSAGKTDVETQLSAIIRHQS
jgi:hypothetical protein